VSVHAIAFPLRTVQVVTGLDPDECERQQRVLCHRYLLHAGADDLTQELVRLYAQGVPIRTLARRFTRSPTTIYAWLRNAGVPNRSRELSAHE
jgi:transposase-like protein